LGGASSKLRMRSVAGAVLDKHRQDSLEMMTTFKLLELSRPKQ